MLMQPLSQAGYCMSQRRFHKLARALACALATRAAHRVSADKQVWRARAAHFQNVQRFVSCCFHGILSCTFKCVFPQRLFKAADHYLRV